LILIDFSQSESAFAHGFSYGEAMAGGLGTSRIFTSSLLRIEASKGRTLLMSIFAGALKISALAVALSCAGAASPAPDSLPHHKASDPASPKLQCRIYFGCAQSARVSPAFAQQEYVR
jgi:hypothetical protein